ncbi:hypothetical protein E5288_WYG017798 [Bos mutus]|uniref:Uncharacterized protein n=1 Tax=Bos mutus TaxID=72004 RepID=A0A6B0RHW6_9CETA|nr:hypothetical protein [Bos mutus]
MPGAATAGWVSSDLFSNLLVPGVNGTEGLMTQGHTFCERRREGSQMFLVPDDTRGLIIPQCGVHQVWVPVELPERSWNVLFLVISTQQGNQGESTTP